MKKVTINNAYAYCIGWCATLLIIDTIYDIDTKVRIAYVVDNTIIGYITNKKVYSSRKGEYIVWGGSRRYLNEFEKTPFYNREFLQEARDIR